MRSSGKVHRNFTEIRRHAKGINYENQYLATATSRSYQREKRKLAIEGAKVSRVSKPCDLYADGSTGLTRDLLAVLITSVRRIFPFRRATVLVAKFVLVKTERTGTERKSKDATGPHWGSEILSYILARWPRGFYPTRESVVCLSRDCRVARHSDHGYPSSASTLHLIGKGSPLFCDWATHSNFQFKV